ncbi:MAG TPA: hypothetical protein VGE24_17560, partial [Emticicia sp.]
MKSKLNLTFLLLIIVQFCLAQKNFTKAKVITVEKDTISGYIDYKEWIKSPTQISFKEDMAQSAVTYTPSQIAGFIIDSNQETYHTLNFGVENLPRSSNKIVYFNMREYTNRTKKMEAVSAFVRIISAGKATLYHYVDKDSEPHFLLKKDDELTVLVYHIIETKNYSAKYRDYQKQLSHLLSDACKPMAFYKTEYYVSSMKKLVDNYNECFSEAVKSVSSQKDRGVWEYGMMVGAGYTKIKHAMATPYRYIDVIGDANITPVGGLFLNYIFARGRGRFALMNEIHTYHLKSKAFFDNEHYNYNMH